MPKLSGEDLVRLGREVKKMRLRVIRLSESSCKLGVLQEGTLPTNATQSINIEQQVDKENKQARMRIRFKLIATYNGVEDTDPAFSITAAFDLQFVLIKSISKKSLEQVGRNTAMVVVWPYWREFVHSMTVRMGLPAFPVPLLSVIDLQEKPREADEQKSS